MYIYYVHIYIHIYMIHHLFFREQKNTGQVQPKIYVPFWRCVNLGGLEKTVGAPLKTDSAKAGWSD